MKHTKTGFNGEFSTERSYPERFSHLMFFSITNADGTNCDNYRTVITVSTISELK